ncbi:MAG: hypothetical protein QOK29_3427, partial [Rhodospirillaceae bacterium]|nr:hypothetical protein [Rhodospirillaceae bacterium]
IDDFLAEEEEKPRRRRWFAWLRRGKATPAPETTRTRWWKLRPTRALVGVLLVAVLLYYPIGALIISKIDDDPKFDAGPVENGASHAIAISAALIDREVDKHAWPANDPFFLPGAILDNMPNFQIGIIQALSRFAVEMTDQIGRTRGSSQADPDLDKAAGLLKYSPTVWIFDPSTSWAPTASSESQYRAARRALLAYNEKLAAGRAVFDRRADNLLSTLDRFAADLGSASAILAQQIDEHSGDFADFRADDIFYNTKGKLYAYALLFRELGKDYAKVIQDRDLKGVWDQTAATLIEAATIRPLVVMNARPDALLLPNHLAVEGFYLMRARTQLREITNILAK